MIKYTPLIIIFSYNLFFVLSGILGYQYLGSESSPVFIIYNVLILVIGVILFFSDALFQKVYFTSNQIFVISIPFIFLAIFLIEYLIGNIDNSGSIHFQYFLLWGLPSILMGIYLSKNNRIDHIIKFMDVIMILFSIAAILTSIEVLTTNTRANIGGATYQNASYIASFAFGINLYYLLFGENIYRFKFAKTTLYRYFCYFLLMLQLFAIVSSGGRGGMVLAIVYFIYLIINSIKENRNTKIFKYFIIISLTFLIGILVHFQLMKISIYESSFSRVFSYISSEGIDISATSGRDSVYSVALEYVYNSPLFGYGIFGMFDSYGGYPHNLFIEILLQGGLIYLIFFLFIFTKLINRTSKILKVDKRFRIICVIAFHPLILLMFSGTYTNQSSFWFTVAFIFSYPYNNLKSVSTVN
ncbi:oligosaccharide repeat unit polymerase [Cerasibacillus terrae]|uniref:Oligosaccharide repeat unit polymerase n=1 Tax=Cerasibacillus terrae TaxID=2498845 RepID=A0A5C8NZQ5_9BACI|nr:O-antigen polymerase [Cerasibacillus terrae]TXL66774.1 oligosaccharide repeat unit polymerase [Cerasibacillus terrae]